MDHLSAIRTFEIEQISKNLVAGQHVLEVGGGNGFQSTILETLCSKTTSIDVNEHPKKVADVTIYDGKRIPLESGTVDRIFSSNVLEHITDLPLNLEEMKRVSTDDVIAVHIVPTPAWRVWTTLTHYPALPEIIWTNLRNLRNNNAKIDQKSTTPEPGNAVGTSPRKKTYFKLKWLFSILVSQRHGERGNRFTEGFYFTRKSWEKLFNVSGWEVVETRPLGVFYTGSNVLGKGLSIPTRRVLSKVFGSATRVFILKKS